MSVHKVGVSEQFRILERKEVIGRVTYVSGESEKEFICLV